MAASIVQAQFINDKQVLLKAAEEAGVQGAQQLLDDENELKSEVSCKRLVGSNVQLKALLVAVAAKCSIFYLSKQGSVKHDKLSQILDEWIYIKHVSLQLACMPHAYLMHSSISVHHVYIKPAASVRQLVFQIESGSIAR